MISWSVVDCLNNLMVLIFSMEITIKVNQSKPSARFVRRILQLFNTHGTVAPRSFIRFFFFFFADRELQTCRFELSNQYYSFTWNDSFGVFKRMCFDRFVLIYCFFGNLVQSDRLQIRYLKLPSHEIITA